MINAEMNYPDGGFEFTCEGHGPADVCAAVSMLCMTLAANVADVAEETDELRVEDGYCRIAVDGEFVTEELQTVFDTVLRGFELLEDGTGEVELRS